MSELEAMRHRIQDLDRALVEAMAERVEVARRIGELKRAAGEAALAPGQEAAVIRRAVEWARERGLPTEPVRQVFWTVVGMCRGEQIDGGGSR